jgi:hypothetical protein
MRSYRWPDPESGLRQLLLFPLEATLLRKQLGALPKKIAQVTTDARIRPIITILTTMSA